MERKRPRCRDEIETRLVRLRRDTEGEWRKVVVDVKVTSMEDMEKSFKEKDDKYREWTTKETREKKVGKAVMVPVIISHDGAVHRSTVKRWNDIAETLRLTECGWPRTS